LVTLEPDAYATNSVLNNASSYVSLITAGTNNQPHLPTPFDVTVVTDFFIPPTGGKVFAHAGVGFWNNDRRLRMTFLAPVDSVSIYFGGGNLSTNETGYLSAYDAGFNLLGNYVTAPLPYGVTELMSLSFTNIAYAVAYSPAGLGNFGRLDALSFNVVPEPPSGRLLALGLGLVVLAAMARGKSPSPTPR
jgi:hypothetical protein